ncbi:lipopolysaccharide biosynthesis protein [Blautia sp. AF19-1]|nr:lipopolysaccharide biosynthesis protein [Blautia sp. AF19-1]
MQRKANRMRNNRSRSENKIREKALFFIKILSGQADISPVTKAFAIAWFSVKTVPYHSIIPFRNSKNQKKVMRVHNKEKEDIMRIKNLFRNSFFSMFSQFALLILGFFSQRAMNLYMGAELVGMNGVISNVINILSVTELGISTAIVYHLYGALARKDEHEIASLMNLYRKAYRIFAVIVFTAGMLLLPLIHLFMKNNSYSLTYIRILYAMWLIRTVLSYLLTDRKSLLIADQKEYIASIAGLILNVVSYLAIILLVTYQQNYLLALGIGIVTEVMLNIWINWYVERKYPFLHQLRKEKGSSFFKELILKDLKNVFISRVSDKMLNCTDNLIISGFIGVGTVGRYANYSMITQAIINILTILANTIQPTIGDYFTEKNYRRNYEILRQLTFVFFCISSVVAVGLFSLITPFICDIWLSPAYELGWGTAVLCIVVLLIKIMGLPLSLMMGVTGLFEKEKNAGASSAVLNLVVSLALVRPYGMTGVLLGTLLSYLLQISYRYVIFFRDFLGMKEEAIRYARDLGEYTAVMILEVAVTRRIIPLIYGNGGMTPFIFCFVLCILVPLALNGVFFGRGWRLQSIVKMVRGMKRSGCR